ncbi:MAG: hypothetical protein AABZ32_03735 [Bacteroidota bacterium]
MYLPKKLSYNNQIFSHQCLRFGNTDALSAKVPFQDTLLGQK